jgi:hypothetical protein
VRAEAGCVLSDLTFYADEPAQYKGEHHSDDDVHQGHVPIVGVDGCGRNHPTPGLQWVVSYRGITPGKIPDILNIRRATDTKLS